MTRQSLKPNVYIVDDDEAIRHSLDIRLSAANFAVRSFEAPRSFLDAAPSLAAGCLVCDIGPPELDGVELLKRLIERHMSFAMVLMAGRSDVATAVRAMKAGAADVVGKPFSDDAILESIRGAQERLERLRNDSETATRAHTGLRLLTGRERQVLEALVAGLPNKTIGHDLGISRRTVEVYRAQVMEKMQARNVSHLVRLALAAGVRF
jgi:two-component system response regulator FixJ